MKKIFLFSLMGVVIVCRAFGQGSKDCSRTFTWWSNDWNAGSNEYLFKTEYDYLATVNNGHFYKCGDQCADCCRGDSYIKMKSGHVFQGFVVNEDRYYKCKTRGNNQWQQIDASATSGLVLCSNEAKIGNGTFRNEEANRYLFPTKNDYDHMKHNTSGAVYECDKQNCTFGTIVTMPAGHYFGRNKINTQRKYKCQNGDFWDDITDDCPDCEKTDSLPSVSPVETCAGGFQLGKLMDTKDCKNVNVSDSDLKTGKECKKVCLKNTDTGEVKGMWYISECPKGMTGVEANYTNIYPHLNHMFEKCIKGNVVGPVKKCDVWKNNPEAFACCNAGLTWNDADKKCEGCPDGKEWNWDAKQKKGECVDKGDDVNPGVVPNGTCQYLFQANVKCANGNTYDVKKYVPVSNTTAQSCEEFLKIYIPDRKAVLKIEQEICENPGGYVVISYGPTQAQVNEARNKISSFFNSAESNASVWKDAEGKFNTARLASDLTAGVVLGTVGGVVSGVVIKKKQVEKGFEALHCTVGGQKIADWGDTFQVGLQ